MKARVFGAGSIGNHITNALKNINYEIEVVDIDELALSRMKNEIYPSRYKEWDDSINLLMSPSENYVDLEVIGTPQDTHSKILLEGLRINRARKWLVEKPFTCLSNVIVKVEELHSCRGKKLAFLICFVSIFIKK